MDQGSIRIFAGTSKTTRHQALAAREMFAVHAATIARDGGTFPERQHLLGMANRFMIGHYQHIIDWATWALEQEPNRGPTPSPRPRATTRRSARCSHLASRCSPQSRRVGQPAKSGLRPQLVECGRDLGDGGRGGLRLRR